MEEKTTGDLTEEVQSDEEPLSDENTPNDHRMLLIIVAVLIGVLVLALVLVYQATKGDKELTAEEAKSVLLTPPAPEEETAYNQLVEENAVESSVLTVGAGCLMEPLVIKIYADQDLIIENNDTVTQVVSFEDQNAFSVSPGKSRVLNISETFTREEGVYRYRCDNISKTENVGIMYIVN